MVRSRFGVCCFSNGVLRQQLTCVGNDGDLQGKEFDNTDGLLGGTMKRLNVMMAQGGSKHMLYLIGFVVLVFVLLYLAIRSH